MNSKILVSVVEVSDDIGIAERQHLFDRGALFVSVFAHVFTEKLDLAMLNCAAPSH